MKKEEHKDNWKRLSHTKSKKKYSLSLLVIINNNPILR